MLSFTWSAFDRGPVARVFDLAIMCQESGQKYALTDELVAFVRLVRSSNELLTLALDESDYAQAVAELGMEVDPPAPYSPGGWLAAVADRLGLPTAG